MNNPYIILIIRGIYSDRGNVLGLLGLLSLSPSTSAVSSFLPNLRRRLGLISITFLLLLPGCLLMAWSFAKQRRRRLAASNLVACFPGIIKKLFPTKWKHICIEKRAENPIEEEQQQWQWHGSQKSHTLMWWVVYFYHQSSSFREIIRFFCSIFSFLFFFWERERENSDANGSCFPQRNYIESRSRSWQKKFLHPRIISDEIWRRWEVAKILFCSREQIGLPGSPNSIIEGINWWRGISRENVSDKIRSRRIFCFPSSAA